MKCELCSQKVKLYEGKGGTNHYEPLERQETLEEAAKLCEKGSKIISGSMGPLMDVGWSMASEHHAEGIRALKDKEN